ncbi:hypothetical protein PWT90_09865 [Aphanocladium album]|nr:hypothetical protein PWT90_09865 [Aphanocladium album]
MVPLPLFKLGSLFLRHISKYGANHIKKQAHDHARFRAFAARYGQMMHQINMRMSVALLRDPEAERRAKEKAEAPTVKTELQTKREEEAKQKEKEREEKQKQKQQQQSGRASGAGAGTGAGTGAGNGTGSTAAAAARPKRQPFQNIWTRKFRSLPEDKAVDLFADVIGDTFILTVAVALILYETWRAGKKPDANKERIAELERRLDEREEELRAAEEKHQQRFETLELALRSLRDPKTKKPLLPSPQEAAPTLS